MDYCQNAQEKRKHFEAVSLVFDARECYFVSILLFQLLYLISADL